MARVGQYGADKLAERVSNQAQVKSTVTEREAPRHQRRTRRRADGLGVEVGELRCEQTIVAGECGCVRGESASASRPWREGHPNNVDYLCVLRHGAVLRYRVPRYLARKIFFKNNSTSLDAAVYGRAVHGLDKIPLATPAGS